MAKNKEIIDIINNGNSIVLKKGKKEENTIEVLDNKLVFSGIRLVPIGMNKINVFIKPKDNVIYESELSTMSKISDTILEEKLNEKAKNKTGYRFYNNVLFLDYNLYGNVNEKMLFKNNIAGMLVTYYYRMGDGLSDDDFDRYSPDIKIEGDKIYNDDMKINVINHFILYVANYVLAGIMFKNNFVK